MSAAEQGTWHGVVVVRPTEAVATQQGLPAFVGVSAATAAARGLSMSLLELPPGAVGEPHAHVGFETAIHVIEGRIETRYGPGLCHRAVTCAGDFLFIAPDVPHQSVNLSTTETARAVVARNTAREEESVRPYAPGAAAERRPRPLSARRTAARAPRSTAAAGRARASAGRRSSGR